MGCRWVRWALLQPSKPLGICAQMAVEPVAVRTRQKIQLAVLTVLIFQLPVKDTQKVYKSLWNLIPKKFGNLFFYFFFLAEISCRPNWPQTLCITKGNHECLVLLPPPPKSWVYKHNPSRLVLYGARYWTLGRHCTNWATPQLSNIVFISTIP